MRGEHFMAVDTIKRIDKGRHVTLLSGMREALD